MWSTLAEMYPGTVSLSADALQKWLYLVWLGSPTNDAAAAAAATSPST